MSNMRPDNTEQHKAEPSIIELIAMLENLLETNGINIQVALENVSKRFRTEMQSSQEYHKSISESLVANKTSPTTVLQHRVLAEIYRSLQDSA